MNGIHDSQEWFLPLNLGTGCSICCFEYRKTSLEGHAWPRTPASRMVLTRGTSMLPLCARIRSHVSVVTPAGA